MLWCVAGQDLEGNADAEALFLWPMEGKNMQVRVHGKVEMLPLEDRKQYFAQLPTTEWQVGLVVFPQSEPVASLEEQEKVLAEGLEKLPYKKNKETGGEGEGDLVVTMPVDFGAYKLIPSSYDFYHGGQFPAVDRVKCTRTEDDQWKWQRLFP